MPKTKILIILGAVAGLILVVGLAVGLTHQSKPTQIEKDSLGADEITSVVEITEVPTEAPTEAQNQTTPQPVDSSVEDDWGQWSKWTPCSQYCRQARMLRFHFYGPVSGMKSDGDTSFWKFENFRSQIKTSPK